MANKTQKNLDPRLRRLLRSSVDKLKVDLSLNNITSSISNPAEPRQFSKRVLLRTNSESNLANYCERVWSVASNIYSAEIQISNLAAIASDPKVLYVEAGRQLSQMLNTSVQSAQASNVLNAQGAKVTGEGVVVAIIDIGLDFTLDDFKNPDGTSRVKYLWDQNLIPQGSEVSPYYGYGVEYSQVDINLALNNVTPFDIVRHKPKASSHGTHVAGIAVGNGNSHDASFSKGQYVGVAPEADIIFVHPNTADSDSSFTDSVHVAEAIAYCFEKADQLGKPCVINMSLGQNGGSHDGESIVERAIDDMLEVTGRSVVLAAGNEHIWRGHASGKLRRGDIKQLEWNFGGGMPLPEGGALPFQPDRTPNELEVWYSSQDRFDVKIIDPSGNETAWIRPDENKIFQLGHDEIYIDSERFTKLNGDARIYIEVSPTLGTLASGKWLVKLKGVVVKDGHYDVWIERDARDRQNMYGDQSYFGKDFDHKKTLGTPATARKAITVGNYDHQTNKPADSSSRGPTRDNQPKPEIAAPGTDIVSSNSLAAQTGQPVRYATSGTSMAAPHVAGSVALLLQQDPNLTSQQAKKILIASTVDLGAGVAFDNAWGYGALNVTDALKLLD